MATAVPPPAPAPPPPPIDHAHHSPPPHIRVIHKTLQKSLSNDEIPILDFSGGGGIPEYHRKRLKLHGTISRQQVREAFAQFTRAAGAGEEEGVQGEEQQDGIQEEGDVEIWEHSSVPGLQLIPSLLPLSIQSTLLTALLTTSLSDTSTHKTNLHAHYTLPTPCNFFTLPSTTVLSPLTSIHKPITLAQALSKKLRWVTLGGQYDWTLKQYPTDTPPEFPADVAGLVSGCFPEIVPQAAIVNLYSPSDTLAPHRDISEASGAGLVSVSIGCAGIFVIGCDGEEEGEVLAVRLNSGDAVVMAGSSRWAWHSVPKILAGTCPVGLEQWDGGSDSWKGWMRGKRVNLNVRQMWG